MNNYVSAIIFGAVQGLTEFLPVSSSGHLVVLHKLLALPVTNELAFDVALHLATLLAVVYFFRKDVFLLASSWFRSLFGEKNVYSRLSWLIIMATIPAAVAGLFLGDYIDRVLRSPFVVITMLVLVGILLLIVDRKKDRVGEIGKLKWSQALTIGFAQAIALIPGTSRSGITIIAGLRAGLKRSEAISFSFLLSIPIIAGASLTKLPQLFKVSQEGEEIAILFLASVSAFIIGVLAIKYFLRFAERYSLQAFAWYRFALALGLLVYFLN